MTERSSFRSSDPQRPLIGADSTSEDSRSSSDLPVMAEHQSDSSSTDSKDDVRVRVFPADNSTKALLEIHNEEDAPHLSDASPPRSRRKTKTKAAYTSTELPSIDDHDPGNDENQDIVSRKHRKKNRKTEHETSDSAELEMFSVSATQRKSVRWTDDMDGGQLHQEHLALSYNRKELSYAPKSKIKVGIFSPLQKKLMIGVGSGCVILLIVLFVVLFVVVKPGAKEPSAPPTSGLFPVSKTPPPESAPDSLLLPNSPEPISAPT